MVKKISIITIITIALGAGLFFGFKKYGVKKQLSIAPSVTEIAKNADSAQEGSESKEAAQDAPGAISELKNPSLANNGSSPSSEGEKPPAEKTVPNADPEEPKVSSGKIVDKLVTWGYEKSTSRKIDTVIVHTSYNSLGGDKYAADKIIEIYKQYGVSAHYLVLRDGTAYRLVADQNISWHAGVSKVPDGRTNVNDFSIGIEVINDQDSKFTDAQYAALNRLIGDLKKKYPIKYILGHNDIAPGRKTDPWGIEWEKINK